MLLKSALLMLSAITSTGYAAPAFNVMKYGSEGNGTTLDSPAIQRAIDGFTLENVSVPVRINMNWNSSYSYATIPPGSTNYSPDWTELANPVPEAQGKAHFQNVRISEIRATAKTALPADGYPSLPLDHFTLSDFDLQTQTADHIADARDWTFSDVTLKTADGSKISLADSQRVLGIATVRAHDLPRPDLAKRSFAEQDRNLGCNCWGISLIGKRPQS